MIRNMDKDKKKSIHALLAKRLYGLLYCTQPAFFPSNNKSFIDLFEKELNILAYLEKTEAKKNDLGSKFLAESLVEKYNSLTNRNFVLSKKSLLGKTTKFEDLYDDINYLAVFCKNIFKVNVDEIIDVVLHQKKLSSGFASSTDSQEKVSPNYSFNNNFGAQFQHSINNSYIYSLATAKAMRDFATGKIYIYKSKPRIIPILKIILFVLLSLSCLASATISIVSWLGQKIPTDDGNSMGLLWMGFCYLVYSLVCGNTIFSLYRQLKMKNLNSKYSFSWSLIISYFFGALLVVIFYFVQVEYFIDWFKVETLKSAFPFQYNCLQIIRYVTIVLFALSMATITCSIVCIVFSPKRDEQIVKSTIDKYVDEFSKSKPPFGA